MIVAEIAKSKNDEFYTPSYAIEPIMKYVKPGGRQYGVLLTQKIVYSLRNSKAQDSMSFILI